MAWGGGGGQEPFGGGRRRGRGRRGGGGEETEEKPETESGTLRTWILLSSLAFSFMISCAFIRPIFFFNIYKGKILFTRSAILKSL